MQNIKYVIAVFIKTFFTFLNNYFITIMLLYYVASYNHNNNYIFLFVYFNILAANSFKSTPSFALCTYMHDNYIIPMDSRVDLRMISVTFFKTNTIA